MNAGAQSGKSQRHCLIKCSVPSSRLETASAPDRAQGFLCVHLITTAISSKSFFCFPPFLLQT